MSESIKEKIKSNDYLCNFGFSCSRLKKKCDKSEKFENDEKNEKVAKSYKFGIFPAKSYGEEYIPPRFQS